MKRDDKYFFTALISFILALVLLPIAFYMVPAAFFGWIYSFPDFMTRIVLFVQASFDLEYRTAVWWGVRVVGIPGFFFAALAYFCSSKLTRNIKINEYLHEKDDPDEVAKMKQDRRDFMFLFLKVFTGFAIVGILLRLFNRFVLSGT